MEEAGTSNKLANTDNCLALSDSARSFHSVTSLKLSTSESEGLSLNSTTGVGEAALSLKPPASRSFCLAPRVGDVDTPFKFLFVNWVLRSGLSWAAFYLFVKKTLSNSYLDGLREGDYPIPPEGLELAEHYFRDMMSDENGPIYL